MHLNLIYRKDNAMKFEIEKDIFEKAADLAARSAATKSTIEAIMGLYIEAKNEKLTVSGYDLTKGMKVIISDAEVEIKDDGVVIVDAKRICETLHVIPDVKIAAEKKNSQLILTWGKGARTNQIQLPIYAEEKDYPEWPNPGDILGKIEIQPQHLNDLMECTKAFVSKNNSRPMYEGLLFEKETGTQLNIVSTDGYRLAWAKANVAETDTQFKAIVPGNSISDVQKMCGNESTLLPMTFEVYSKHIKFIIGENELITRRIDENGYLDYKKSINNCLNMEYGFSVEKSELMATLIRAKISDKTSSAPVRLSFTDGDTRFIMQTSSAFMEEWLDVSAEENDKLPEKMEIGYNPEYLLQGLKAFSSGKKIKVLFNGPTSPALLRNEEEPKEGETAMYYMVLPVRLKAS